MILPITKYKNEIIEAVRNHSFTIISANAGVGKSTQVPQFLDEYFGQIIVTEPRIMAAKTLARRIAEEMGVAIGQEVGYQTAYEKCSSSDSKIVYCTDGLQLIKTIFNEDCKTENVLVIDEVHEWNRNIELLIAWSKFMYKKWNTRVVMMSATLETNQLANFFGKDVAVMNIAENLYDVAVEERPKYALIDTIKENINKGKNILVFVAGKKEIQTVMENLKEEDATVLPLHAELDWDDQKKCFEYYSNPKVVVATNVAQTSITIPDIDVVVDTGEARMSISENGIQGLFLRDISRSDIMQRKGRAGRTKSGKYILCSDTPINSRREYPIPEIQRSILDRVVLQIAEIGLDAEKLEFFHQPDTNEIHKAKKELNSIGALSGNQVTELGHKIVKIPVSTNFARMVVEAEKYGVTEQVMTIASIIEMGGLLTKGSRYADFTTEEESDLLAEFDVWNSINKLGYIDFKNLGINKKNFFKIRDHIQKLKGILKDIVEMSSKNDRKAILKSCLSGLVSNVYVKKWLTYEYCGIDETRMQLDRNSCISRDSNIIVGIPKKIESKNYYGKSYTLNIVSFASRMNLNTIYELAPNVITEESSLCYSKSEDAVEIIIRKRIAGIEVYSESYYDKKHPLYAELKAKYEEELSYYSNWSKPQKVVVIDGKQFIADYKYFEEKWVVYLDNETLFTTSEKEVFFDSGEKVYFCSNELSRIEENIVALRNAVEMNRIRKIRGMKKHEYESLRISKLDDVIKNDTKIGKIELTKDNGGYGDNPIFVYGYIVLKKNAVTFMLGDDEETAKSNTEEALQYLFYKEIEKKYGESKFSHQNGSKKKVLTKSEMEVKEDFYALVRDVTGSISIENIKEYLDFLEEYYQELMN